MRVVDRFEPHGSSPSEIEPSLIDISTSHGDDFFYICTQYWATCVKVYCEVRALQQRLYTFTTLRTTVSPLAPEIDPEPPAHHLAQTSSHFFRPGAGLWSAQSAVFPVGTALFYFAKTGRVDTPLFQAMLRTFEESRTGVVMRDFVRNIVFDCRQF